VELEARELYGAFWTLFGESRTGLLDAPAWMYEIAEIEDSVRVWYYKREKEKARQREILEKHGLA